MKTIIALSILGLIRLVHLYIIKENSIAHIGVWKSFALGYTYHEEVDQEGPYVRIEVYIGFVVLTLMYDKY